ncbi:PIN domain-like protein [Mycena metata]|uniref:PIN domain-like protein n=1 Tax=Mycena metata TaxID=1033252 RepID=A0AAD7KDD9_9AGAR|nr:PIN domain-like protein [Mycena metata]KAJ7783365.1 PIN domain-like protein [Mycena metata]
MGVPKLWEILGPAAETKSLLNLATMEGFQSNNRGLRTLIIGVDISIKINAIIAALQAAGVFTHGRAGEKLVLQKLFYHFCQLLLAPLTVVFFFDGPGRPPIKRGTRVIHRPTWLIQQLKAMITAFGFFFYEAPGEAEAELAQLNNNGEIDAIITEDGDAFLFGARCVIRTLGSSVQHSSLIFTSESIENSVSLDKCGLLLYALLLGGDYGPGLTGAGVTVAHALAAEGFGEELTDILISTDGIERQGRLAVWRERLRHELQTNSSGRLAKRQFKLADTISESFPDVQVAELYLNPLTSRSPGFTGPMPTTQVWRPREPSIVQLSAFCSAQFDWHGDELLKKLNSQLWPGVIFRMISSPLVLHDPTVNRFTSPSTNAHILKKFLVHKHKPAFEDSAGLELYRVRMSTVNFIQLASLEDVAQTAEADIKLVSIPKAILVVAMRDPSSSFTKISHTPSMSPKSDSEDNQMSNNFDTDMAVMDDIDSEGKALARAYLSMAKDEVIDLTWDF